MRRYSFLKFVTLFAVGFFGYAGIELLYRHYTYILMAICGGIAIVLLDRINDEISWDLDILIQGSIGSLIITGMEFIIGELYLRGILPKMWDYTTMPLNYKGIVCLPFSLAWVALSIVAIVIADWINYYIFKENATPYYKLFGMIIYRFRDRG